MCGIYRKRNRSFKYSIVWDLHPEREKVHAICTEMDHNSVLRPLYLLEKEGLDLTILPADRKE